MTTPNDQPADEKKQPVITQLKFRCRDGYFELTHVGQAFTPLVCEDIIKMVQAQSDALVG